MLTTGWKFTSLPIRAQAIQVLAVGLALSIACTFLRIVMIWTPPNSFREAVWIIRRGFYNSYLDNIVVWSVSLLALMLLALPTRRSTKHVVTIYLAFAFASVLFACINFTAVRILGGSLTYQWLYYADLFQSVTAHASIKSAVNEQTVIIWTLAFVLFLISSWVFLRLLQFFDRKRRLPMVVAPGLTILVVLIAIAARGIGDSEAARMTSTNPWVELITTALAAQDLDISQSPDLAASTPLPPATDDKAVLPAELRDAGIRNVLIVVMESVGAKSLKSRDIQKDFPFTPEIDAFSASTISFENFYAHSPMSSKSMYSIMTGRYPEFTFEAETTRFRGTRLQTLGSIVKENGYRTSLFMSGDIEFQGNGDFVAQSGFDIHLDRQGIPCRVATYKAASADWPYLDAIDDSCTAKRLIEWLSADKKTPFLSVMWTNNTHYPYFRAVGDNAGFNTGDLEKDRYLSAIQASDAAIGSILSYLKENDLLATTLVVILGDHGEAFGEHGWRIHGSDVFEEQVHIPLLLINPSIKGRQSRELGGLSDLAPTILHILGLKAHEPWEGRSLFDPNRPKRLFVFAPNQSMTAGYREGDMKYIFRLSRNKASVFNLKDDPGETQDLADAGSGESIRQSLAVWLRERKSFSAKPAVR